MEQKRIAIICYSYSDGFAYMEQKLAQTFSDFGNKVVVICSTANRIDSSTVIHVKAGEYETDKYAVCRLPFIIGGHLPDHKLPIVLKGMYSKLEKYKPDIIYHMSCSAINLLSVKKYMKRYPNTKLFADNHASMTNSANNFVSKYFLHKYIYKNIIRSIDKYIINYFYVGHGERIFIEDFYGLDRDKCKFFSLGDFVVEDKQYTEIRQSVRNDYNIEDGDVVVAYSGKFTKKKKTIEIIRMMIKILDTFKNTHFILIGQVQDESIRQEFDALIHASPLNMHYIGWLSSDKLMRILCGSDIYIQYEPSSSFQTALCCRNYGITGNADREYDEYPNNVFSKVYSIEEMYSVLIDCISNKSIGKLRDYSFDYAKENLDYRNQIEHLIFQKCN